MRTLAEHLDNARSKPHHIRRQVALGAAGLVTGLVAAVWLGASLYTGAFALKGSNFAQLTGAEPATGSADTIGPTSGAGGSAPTTEGVAGAAAGLDTSASSDNAPAHVEVVPTGEGATAQDAQTGQSGGANIIPF